MRPDLRLDGKGADRPLLPGPLQARPARANSRRIRRGLAGWGLPLVSLLLAACIVQPQPPAPVRDEAVVKAALRASAAPGGGLLPQPDTPPVGALLPQPDTPPVTGILPQPDTPPIAHADAPLAGGALAAPVPGAAAPAGTEATRVADPAAAPVPEPLVADAGLAGPALTMPKAAPSTSPSPSPSPSPP